jgi:hypothetical protein
MSPLLRPSLHGAAPAPTTRDVARHDVAPSVAHDFSLFAGGNTSARRVKFRAGTQRRGR